jgi:FkbM family methyltransferase
MVVHSVKLSAQRWLIRNHWRLKRFIPDGYFAFRYPGGRIYWNPKHSPGMLARALGLYENDKMNAVFRLLKPSATFIDVGGNVGDYSLLAARIIGDTGRVICFEPEPTNCHWIERSIELNGYRNISLYALALSDANGEASLYLGTQCGFHSLLKDQPERQAGVIQVKTRTLDSVLHEIGWGTVDMMKIDVEGAELQVLRGARGTLEMNPQVILLLELHPGMGVNPGEVCDFLRGQGFCLFEVSFPFNKPLEINSHVRELIARRISSRSE